MISATKTLLLATPIMLANVANAAYSPTKANAKTFPLFEKGGVLVVHTNTADLKDTVLTADSGKKVKTAIAQNKAGQWSGTYQGYRIKDFITAVNQAVPVTDGDDAPVITKLGKGQSFYETTKGNQGKMMDASSTTLTGKSDVAGATAIAGDQYNICSKVQMLITAARANALNCWGLVVASAAGGTKTTGMKDRVFFDSTDNGQHTNTVGDAGKVNTMKSWSANQDIILGSLYGQIDTVANAGWCSGAFYNEVKTSVTTNTAKLQGQTGFGPRAKCTWQIASEKNTHGPIIELNKMPQTDALFQVIEWFDTTFLGTDGIITATAAGTGPSFIAAATTTMDAKNGVFINPITALDQSTDGGINAVANLPTSPIYCQDNALDNAPNSIGTVAYYSRDSGQSKDLIYGVDSVAVTGAVGVYAAQVTAFNALKTTYDTDKTAYETAVEDKKKDPKKTVPTRPAMPSQPSAYSGPNLRLSGQNIKTVTDLWATKIKTDTGAMQGLLATSVVADNAPAKTTRPVYDQTKLITEFHNRVSYVTISTAGDKDKMADVAVAFGRLGQGAATNFKNGSPFQWTIAETTSKPGMQVSIFPEWNNNELLDWTIVTASTEPTINYGIKTFAALSDFETPAQPAAATAIADAAINMAAASVVAVAAVASTMF